MQPLPRYNPYQSDLMTLNVKTYDGYRRWKQWDRLFEPASNEVMVFRKELKGIPLEGCRLLDIGFGSGALLGWAKSEGAKIAGIELQDELRNAARERGIMVYEGFDGVPDSSFDIITAFDVLEHIPRDSLVEFLKQIQRIATPDAHIVIRVPNCQSPAGLLTQFGDATHVTMLSGPIVAQLCDQAGLTVKQVRGAVDLELPMSPLRQLTRPFKKIFKILAKLILRAAWSSGPTPLSANVLIMVGIAAK